ncbi:MAG TPA: enoyl-CoA hydratase-related protein [Gemmataceae bacterium]|nr:enoyl-CoA hydratase-related protein [Gemmataceae bacterium]
MSAIHVAVSEAIARLTFDQPDSRANVLSTALWAEFGQALDALAHQPGLTGLVLASAKPGIFIAGADLKELADADPANPEPTRAFLELGLRVLETLEALPFPTVALIDGAALGGGLEVALACDFRLCGTNPKIQLGQPEIKLGLIPGWGGTQRLPRLVGVEEAINRLLSGESYDATDPPPEDLVDETVSSEQLLGAAARWLATGDWHEVREAKRSLVPADLLPSAEFLAETRQTLDVIDPPMRPAAAEILKAVLEGSLTNVAAGIRLETAAFLRLAGTPNSRQLIADFFAKRKR